ncbi:unnamed protein product, partial [Ilex paraguariensis]
EGLKNPRGRDQLVPELRKSLFQSQGPIGPRVRDKMVPELRIRRDEKVHKSGTSWCQSQRPVSLGVKDKLVQESEGTSKSSSPGLLGPRVRKKLNSELETCWSQSQGPDNPGIGRISRGN